MLRKRANNSYTIQPFQLGADQNEVNLLYINFRADNLAAAKAQAAVYARDGSFLEDIHGLKLMRNIAEIWRWSKGDPIQSAEE
jgi:hypothetical protein